jgi:hypothetical protein
MRDYAYIFLNGPEIPRCILRFFSSGAVVVESRNHNKVSAVVAIPSTQSTTRADTHCAAADMGSNVQENDLKQCGYFQ